MSSLQLPFGIDVLNPVPVDAKYNNNGTPWASTSAVNAAIASGVRYIGLTVNINGVEYWYASGITDGDLVVKTAGSGSGSTVTAGDGLTKTGDEIRLGGDFENNITINLVTPNQGFAITAQDKDGSDLFNVYAQVSGGSTYAYESIGAGYIQLNANGPDSASFINVDTTSAGIGSSKDVRVDGGAVVVVSSTGSTTIQSTGSFVQMVSDTDAAVVAGYSTTTLYGAAFASSVSVSEHVTVNAPNNITLSANGISGESEILLSGPKVRVSTSESGFKGIEYQSDYSPNFGPRSLPDVEWVLNNAGGSVSAGNGLTLTGDSIILGGTLTGYTRIETTGFGISIGANTDASAGYNSMAVGYATISSGDASFASGSQTQASGNYSHSQGETTYASGRASHAEGFTTHAAGTYSHAEGKNTCANGAQSHAEGYCTIACSTAHAEGDQTRAIGVGSHSEGGFSCSIGTNSHAEGRCTKACGSASHAEGFSAYTFCCYSHAEGCQTKACGIASHAEGILTFACGLGSHSEGQASCAIGDQSHAEGLTSKAFCVAAHAEGCQTTSCGLASHSEGLLTIASGATSHAEGCCTRAGGTASHAEGYSTRSLGTFSHAEGFCTTARGTNSHVQGCGSSATGTSSHAEGQNSFAGGFASHAEGNCTCALGNASHSQGCLTSAIGAYSSTAGFFTRSCGIASHSSGCGSSFPVIAGGCVSFNHSTNGVAQSSGHGALAHFSAILGGQNHNITTGNTNAVILGGNGIKLTGNSYTDTTAVSKLAIMSAPSSGVGSDLVLVRNPTTGLIRTVSQSFAASSGSSYVTMVTITASTTLNATHAGKVILASGTINITLPAGMTNGMVVNIVNVGLGVVTLVNANAKFGNNKLANTWAGAVTFYNSTLTTWITQGDLTS